MVMGEELDVLFLSETKRSDHDFWRGPRIPGDVFVICYVVICYLIKVRFC